MTGEAEGSRVSLPSADPRAAVAVHEASHLVAARTLGRPTGGASIEDGVAGAEVGLIRSDHEPGLEEVLDELTILAIGDLAAGWDDEPAARFVQDGDGRDGDRAVRVALRVCATGDEASALIELGRAKARTLAADSAFAERVEALAAVLLERGAVTPDTVDHLLDYLNESEAVNGKTKAS